MKICVNDTLGEFREKILRCDRGIVIFGARIGADLAINYLPDNVKVKFFIDTDEKRQGHNMKSWGGRLYDVYGIESISKLTKEDIIFIATDYYLYVVEMIAGMFDGTVYIMEHFRKAEFFTNFHYSEFSKERESLKLLMSDDESRELVDIIYNKRIYKDIDYRTVCKPNQYFQEDLIRADMNAVFVDGGCYNGDTVRDFINFQNGLYKKVYSFEPDNENYKKINRNDFDDRVLFLNYGMADEKKDCYFMASGTVVSKIVPDSGQDTVRIHCVKLDDYIDKEDIVTWIKMDIEGSEQEALVGSENIIIENKPILTISAYHKPQDLWEIPYYIHELVPEYRFYLRHHTTAMDDTVLYAVI